MSLCGKRVLVTRAEHQSGSLIAALRNSGADPVPFPAIRVAPPADPKPFRRAVGSAGAYDWLVLTSTNGVAAFFDELLRQGQDCHILEGVRIAAIGPATADALRGRGAAVDVIPSEYRGEAVAEAMVEAQGGSLEGMSVLLPRAAEAREVLPEMLRRAGADVVVVESYRTLPPEETEAAGVRTMLQKGDLDVVTFTSSSTVANTVLALGADATQLLASATIASIGPITTQTAEGYGLRVDVSAAQYTIQGLVSALEDFFAR